MPSGRRRIVTYRNGAIIGSIVVIGAAGTVVVNRTFDNPDTTPPVAKFTSPASRAFVYGDVALTATCQDTPNPSCASVQFTVDGDAVGALDTTAPFEATWPTADEIDGAHTLSAIATDAAGNTQTLTSRTVTVANESANEFVASNGNDSGGGCVRHATPIAFPADPTTVCRTLAKAVSLMAPGDHATMWGGTYPGETLNASTTNGKPGDTPIVFSPAPGQTVTFSSPIIFSTGITLPLSYVTFDGLDRTTMPQFLVLYDGDTEDGTATERQATHVTLKNTHVTNTDDSHGGLILARDTSYFTAEGNDVGPGCCSSDAIDIAIQSEGNIKPDHTTLTGNLIHDVYDTCTQYPTYLGSCTGVGFGDVDVSRILTADLAADDTTMHVSSGLPWLGAFTGYFFVYIGSEVLEASGGFTTTTWTVKRGADCDTPGGSHYCSGSGSTHTAGATVGIFNAGYDHVDGTQMYGGDTIDVTRNKYLLQGDHRQSLFLQTANGGTFSGAITVANNFFTNTSDNTVTFGGPGTGLWSGDLRFLYNTDRGSFYVYNLLYVPGSTVEIAGNLIEANAGNQAGGGCTMTYSDGSTLTPTWSKNMIGNTGNNSTCGGANIFGTATFALPNFPGGTCAALPDTGCTATTGLPDLHLNGTQTAVGGGENTYCPATDIDGDTRPTDVPCALGADQP